MNLNISSRGCGKALVLFHGWGFDQAIWHNLAEALADKVTLYLVDLPGFGQSPMMSWELFKSRLFASLPPHFALVGWSMGGLYATRLAIEHPLRVTHLINVATSPCFIKNNAWPGVEKTILNTFFEDLTRNSQQTLEQFIALQLQNYNYQASSRSSPSLEGLEQGLDILATWDLRELLPTLQCPTCYMFGRLDSIVPRTTMNTMQKMYPDFDYVMFNKAAHIPFLTHKNEFIKELEEYLV